MWLCAKSRPLLYNTHAILFSFVFRSRTEDRGRGLIAQGRRTKASFDFYCLFLLSPESNVIALLSSQYKRGGGNSSKAPSACTLLPPGQTGKGVLWTSLLGFPGTRYCWGRHGCEELCWNAVWSQPWTRPPHGSGGHDFRKGSVDATCGRGGCATWKGGACGRG